MPTDTQRAPTLAQCIEREREAAGRVRDWFAGVTGPAPLEQLDVDLDRARAATDEAVRAVEGLLARVETMMTYGASLSEIASIRAAIRQAYAPAPTPQGESTGGGDE